MAAAVPAVAERPASNGAPPGEYTYQQALKLGIASPRDWQRPRGMPVCPPIPDPHPDLPDGASIRPNAPTCWTPPEELGLVFLVLPPGDPGFGVVPDPTDPSTGDAVYPATASWPFSPLSLLGVYLDGGS
jgi:hypothetical protein